MAYLIHKTARREYWLSFDNTARVFEMFASRECNDYLGAFDEQGEALSYAKQHAREAA